MPSESRRTGIERIATSYEWMPVACAALFFLLPFVPDTRGNRLKLLFLELGLFLMVLLWTLGVVWHGRIRLALSPVAAAVAAWLGFVLIRAMSSDYPALAGAESRKAVFCLAAFFVATQVRMSGRGSLAVWRAWSLGAGLAALTAFVAFLAGQPPQTSLSSSRLEGGFGSPILFGTYLSISLFVLWGVRATAATTLEKRLADFASLACLIALILSGTRAAWLGASTGFAVWFWIVHRRQRYFRQLLLVAIFAAAMFISATKSVWLRDQAHLAIWRDTLKLSLQNPIVGVGLGEFHIHFPEVESEDLKSKWPPKETIVNHAHNEPLQVLAETGALGLVLWLASYWMFFRGFMSSHWFAHGFSAAGTQGQSPSATSDAQVDAVIAICVVTVGLVQSLFSADSRLSAAYVVPYFVMGMSAHPKETIWEQAIEASHPLRLATIAALFVAFGVVGVNSSSAGWLLNVGGVFQISWDHRGLQAHFSPSEIRNGLLPKVLRPYVAAYRARSAHGFFEEAASGATTSLDELEALSQAFPDDARGFERVGYACAQRMQSHDSAGKTIVNFEMATRALTAYQRASTLAPNNPGPYNNIGNIYFTLGNRREAVQFWVKSLDVDPRQVNSRLNLGKVFYLDGRLREAASEFQKVLEYEPDNSEALSYLKRMRE